MAAPGEVSICLPGTLSSPSSGRGSPAGRAPTEGLCRRRINKLVYAGPHHNGAAGSEFHRRVPVIYGTPVGCRGYIVRTNPNPTVLPVQWKEDAKQPLPHTCGTSCHISASQATSRLGQWSWTVYRQSMHRILRPTR